MEVVGLFFKGFVWLVVFVLVLNLFLQILLNCFYLQHLLMRAQRALLGLCHPEQPHQGCTSLSYITVWLCSALLWPLSCTEWPLWMVPGSLLHLPGTVVDHIQVRDRERDWPWVSFPRSCWGITLGSWLVCPCGATSFRHLPDPCINSYSFRQNWLGLQYITKSIYSIPSQLKPVEEVF